jgi:hypothetical protein
MPPPLCFLDTFSPPTSPGWTQLLDSGVDLLADVELAHFELAAAARDVDCLIGSGSNASPNPGGAASVTGEPPSSRPECPPMPRPLSVCADVHSLPPPPLPAELRPSLAPSGAPERRCDAFVQVAPATASAPTNHDESDLLWSLYQGAQAQLVSMRHQRDHALLGYGQSTADVQRLLYEHKEACTQRDAAIRQRDAACYERDESQRQRTQDVLYIKQLELGSKSQGALFEQYRRVVSEGASPSAKRRRCSK